MTDVFEMVDELLERTAPAQERSPTMNEPRVRLARAVVDKIAARAEVLDIARDLLAAWDACDEEAGWEPLNDPDLWDALRAAIAKAEGRVAR